jgi:membrane dipeptidase
MGGLIGGSFAMYVPPQHPPVNDLRVTKSSYEVRWAEPLDAAYARRKTWDLLTALKRLEARADGRLRIATSLNEIDGITRARSFAIVLHLEGADGIDADLYELEKLYRSGLRLLGLVWSRRNIFGHGVPFAWPRYRSGTHRSGKKMVAACNRLRIMIDCPTSTKRASGTWRG